MDNQTVSGNCCNADTSLAESMTSHAELEISFEPKRTRPNSCAVFPTYLEETKLCFPEEKLSLKQKGDAETQGCSDSPVPKSHKYFSSCDAKLTGKNTTTSFHSGSKCSACSSCSKSYSTEQISQKTQHDCCKQCKYQRNCDRHSKQNEWSKKGIQQENSSMLETNDDNNKAITNEPSFAHVDMVERYSRADLISKNGDLKERDDYIRDYQLQQLINERNTSQQVQKHNAEFVKLRNNYNSLKKFFVALATSNIVLILCVVSIFPIILVSFKIHGAGDVQSEEDIESIAEKQLFSDSGRDIIKKHVFCVDCKRITDELSDIFTKIDGKGCCLNDVATLAENILKRKEKNLSKLVNAKVRYYMSRSGHEEYQPNIHGSEGGAVSYEENSKISKLINTLLTRKRSAIHLSGTIRHHTMAWTKSFPEKAEGKLKHRNNVIHVESGGVYFLYSCIRFQIGQCDRKNSVGYRVMTTHDQTSTPIASVQHECKDGFNSETDLIIQKIIEVPVKDDATTLHVHINFSPDLVSKNHHHYFGLFEI